MTQALSKERLEEVAELARKATYKPCALHMSNLIASCDSEIVEAMARALLAEHEQEPVAVVELSDYVTAAQLSGDEPRKKAVKELYEGALIVGQNLYTHPAPSIPAAVPDDVNGPLAHAYKDLTPTFMRNHIAVFERYGITPSDGSTVIQALRIALDGMERRAAMLQAEPVRKPYKLPDGYMLVPVEPTQDMIWAAKNVLSSTIGWDSFKRAYQSMLAAAPKDAHTCWCHTCRPITMSDMRFVVCPDCGNKRCPKANDHRNACSGSNEPGQEGSAYPAAPKGV